MDSKVRAEIKGLLLEKLAEKLSKHTPESEYKPFFEAIFNKKQIALASLIQSFYTAFGMSIYEQMAVAISRGRGNEAERQYKLLGQIDRETEALIDKIDTDLRAGKLTGDANKETELIRKSIKPGKPERHPDSIVDLYIRMKENKEYYIGITTVKPNKEGFETHKRKLLNWMALRLSQNKHADVHVATVLPYNPFGTEPYKRFGSDTLFDNSQFLVQEEFWDFIGGKGTFKELIEICKEVGTELREQIDEI
jgi:Type II restriction endonuclease, TdeIII